MIPKRKMKLEPYKKINSCASPPPPSFWSILRKNNYHFVSIYLLDKSPLELVLDNESVKEVVPKNPLKEKTKVQS